MAYTLFLSQRQMGSVGKIADDDKGYEHQENQREEYLPDGARETSDKVLEIILRLLHYNVLFFVSR